MSSKRPKRTIIHKKLEYNEGMLWQEERALRKALYASLHPGRLKTSNDEDDDDDEDSEIQFRTNPMCDDYDAASCTSSNATRTVTSAPNTPTVCPTLGPLEKPLVMGSQPVYPTLGPLGKPLIMGIQPRIYSTSAPATPTAASVSAPCTPTVVTKNTTPTSTSNDDDVSRTIESVILNGMKDLETSEAAARVITSRNEYFNRFKEKRKHKNGEKRREKSKEHKHKDKKHKDKDKRHKEKKKKHKKKDKEKHEKHKEKCKEMDTEKAKQALTCNGIDMVLQNRFSLKDDLKREMPCKVEVGKLTKKEELCLKMECCLKNMDVKCEDAECKSKDKKRRRSRSRDAVDLSGNHCNDSCSSDGGVKCEVKGNSYKVMKCDKKQNGPSVKEDGYKVMKCDKKQSDPSVKEDGCKVMKNDKKQSDSNDKKDGFKVMKSDKKQIDSNDKKDECKVMKSDKKQIDSNDKKDSCKVMKSDKKPVDFDVDKLCDKKGSSSCVVDKDKKRKDRGKDGKVKECKKRRRDSIKDDNKPECKESENCPNKKHKVKKDRPVKDKESKKVSKDGKTEDKTCKKEKRKEKVGKCVEKDKVKVRRKRVQDLSQLEKDSLENGNIGRPSLRTKQVSKAREKQKLKAREKLQEKLTRKARLTKDKIVKRIKRRTMKDRKCKMKGIERMVTRSRDSHLRKQQEVAQERKEKVMVQTLRSRLGEKKTTVNRRRESMAEALLKKRIGRSLGQTPLTDAAINTTSGTQRSSQATTSTTLTPLKTKKPCLQAQRKFAHSLPSSPSTTPLHAAYTGSSSGGILLNYCPKTEDFLTFLCLREISSTACSQGSSPALCRQDNHLEVHPEDQGSRSCQDQDSRVIQDQDPMSIQDQYTKSFQDQDSTSIQDQESRFIQEQDSRSVHDPDSRSIQDQDYACQDQVPGVLQGQDLSVYRSEIPISADSEEELRPHLDTSPPEEHLLKISQERLHKYGVDVSSAPASTEQTVIEAATTSGSATLTGHTAFNFADLCQGPQKILITTSAITSSSLAPDFTNSTLSTTSNKTLFPLPPSIFTIREQPSKLIMQPNCYYPPLFNYNGSASSVMSMPVTSVTWSTGFMNSQPQVPCIVPNERPSSNLASESNYEQSSGVNSVPELEESQNQLPSTQEPYNSEHAMPSGDFASAFSQTSSHNQTTNIGDQTMQEIPRDSQQAFSHVNATKSPRNLQFRLGATGNATCTSQGDSNVSADDSDDMVRALLHRDMPKTEDFLDLFLFI